MERALYRKYRSRSLDEVVGQPHIVATLRSAIKSGRISHAYLFTGPRGVGKTSIARILAHEVNNIDYRDDSFHLDIIEIDGASNRRIDEIRELRDKVHTAPASAKYKIYIIDEVHMLTREAFNALLKTLEEPPAHCIFILATTEVHKLPETIISRTQRFSFQPITPEAIAGHLRVIAKKEKITIDEDSLDMLARHADGSFRDAISMLDQLGSRAGKITAKNTLELLGIPPSSAINQLLQCIWNGNSETVHTQLRQLSDQGISAAALASEMNRYLRTDLISGNRTTERLNLMRDLLSVPASHHPAELLEITILDHTLRNTSDNDDVPPQGPPVDSNKKPVIKTEDAPKITRSATSIKPAIVETSVSKSERKVQPFDTIIWQQVLGEIKQSAASLYTALRLAEPRSDGTKLTLAFQFPLHQKKLNNPTQKDMLQRVLSQMGADISEIECIVDRAVIPLNLPEVVKEPVMSSQAVSGKVFGKELQTISNIFGTAEVLES